MNPSSPPTLFFDRESGDHGPFNSWDRQPFLTTIRTGEPSMTPQWREIHHNFFIDNYSPQENVDNDDGSSYYKTHHNFLVYGGNGMKNDFGALGLGDDPPKARVLGGLEEGEDNAPGALLLARLPAFNTNARSDLEGLRTAITAY